MQERRVGVARRQPRDRVDARARPQRGEVVRRHRSAIVAPHEVVEARVEFAPVARPRLPPEEGARGVVEVRRGTARRAREVVESVLGEAQEFRAPFREARHPATLAIEQRREFRCESPFARRDPRVLAQADRDAAQHAGALERVQQASLVREREVFHPHQVSGVARFRLQPLERGALDARRVVPAGLEPRPAREHALAAARRADQDQGVRRSAGAAQARVEVAEARAGRVGVHGALEAVLVVAPELLQAQHERVTVHDRREAREVRFVEVAPPLGLDEQRADPTVSGTQRDRDARRRLRVQVERGVRFVRACRAAARQRAPQPSWRLRGRLAGCRASA